MLKGKRKGGKCERKKEEGGIIKGKIGRKVTYKR
jgi:hypothetical protein